MERRNSAKMECEKKSFAEAEISNRGLMIAGWESELVLQRKKILQMGAFHQ